MEAENMPSYRERLRATLVSQGAAYGFTLTVWGAGGLAAAEYGPLTALRVVLFVSGVLVMYGAMVVVLYRPHEAPSSLADVPHTAFAFLDLISVPAALGTAFMVYRILPNPLYGFPVGSFLATLVYNLLLAAQVLIFVPRLTGHDRE